MENRRFDLEYAKQVIHRGAREIDFRGLRFVSRSESISTLTIEELRRSMPQNCIIEDYIRENCVTVGDTVLLVNNTKIKEIDIQLVVSAVRGSDFRRLRILFRNFNSSITLEELESQVVSVAVDKVRRENITSYENLNWKGAIHVWVAKRFETKLDSLGNVQVVCADSRGNRFGYPLDFVIDKVKKSIFRILKEIFKERKIDPYPRWWGERDQDEIQKDLDLARGGNGKPVLPSLPSRTRNIRKCIRYVIDEEFDRFVKKAVIVDDRRKTVVNENFAPFVIGVTLPADEDQVRIGGGRRKAVVKFKL